MNDENNKNILNTNDEAPLANEDEVSEQPEKAGTAEKGEGTFESLKENEGANESVKSVGQTYAAPPAVSAVKNKNDKQKKKMAAIVIIACVIGVIVTVVGIVSIVNLITMKPDPGKVDASTTSPVSQDGSYNAYVPESVTHGDESEVMSNTDTASVYVPDTTKKMQNTTARNNSESTTDVQQTIEGLPPLEKTGDNILSDRPDNEFIVLVSEKYNVDPEKLVAIYAVPDNGTNFVLEFSGERDASGEIIKSPDTLKKIHQIDKERNVTTATGSITGNVGVSYAEGKLVFYLVTNVVMPQYPDYFTGVQANR